MAMGISSEWRGGGAGEHLEPPGPGHGRHLRILNPSASGGEGGDESTTDSAPAPAPPTRPPPQRKQVVAICLGGLRRRRRRRHHHGPHCAIVGLVPAIPSISLPDKKKASANQKTKQR